MTAYTLVQNTQNPITCTLPNILSLNLKIFLDSQGVMDKIEQGGTLKKMLFQYAYS